MSRSVVWSMGQDDILAGQRPVVYSELLNLATKLRRQHAPDVPVESADLVNELSLSIAMLPQIVFPDRESYLGFCETLILLDLHARKIRWDSSRRNPPLAERHLILGLDVLMERAVLRESLNALGKIDPRACSIVELMFFGGLTHEEIAERLRISATTVKREWRSARLWLANKISDGVLLQFGISRIGENLPISERKDCALVRDDGFGGRITLELVDPAVLKAIEKHPDLFRSLDWRTFERVLARIFDLLGYEVELQQGTKDGGVDIFAVCRNSELGTHRYLLQAKQWKNSVGVEPVREILFLQDQHKVTKACLATTSRFTRGAWELSEQFRWRLELADFEKLIEWVSLARHARNI